ncbi:MAG: DUF262 domain-containing protein [Brachybacterium sp.]|uniref:DUF262 domain-containing protein n=1 Tax=Brachybacterium sp. TaxID=1891286 RepID=UPI002649DCE2|nr:DUF262 domain-containing protein [Brachybacterium sp.]MDN5686265.1 DUF262 domain-containing protein [Brachybacterium sp.]
MSEPENIPDNNVAELIDRSLTDEEYSDLTDSEQTPTKVTFSTQDYSVDSLVSRMNSGAMVIPKFGGNDERVNIAGFQRGFVWSKAQMDRFIESLLLGYPIPGIFLVKQASNNRLLVLDGQQRLTTLQQFYKGVHNGRVFSLQYVGDEYRGTTYESLDETLKFKLDDSFMQATIVTTDGSNELDEAVYQIFERLNAGGTQLTPHEIRVALFAGPLMMSLQKLNEDENWRALFGGRSKRIRDHELIMRIIALYLRADAYSRPLKKFLNSFASDYRQADLSADETGNLFSAAVLKLNSTVGKSAFRRYSGQQVNTAQAEAICVATMHALANDNLTEDLPEAIRLLLQNQDFLDSSARATADRDAVETRLREARGALEAR